MLCRRPSFRDRGLTAANGPSLPSAASVGHGSYRGISFRQPRSCTTAEDEPVAALLERRPRADASPLPIAASTPGTRATTLALPGEPDFPADAPHVGRQPIEKNLVLLDG
jgi:hypothetical protein